MAYDKTVIEKAHINRVTLGAGVTCKPGDLIGLNSSGTWVLATNAAGAAVRPRYIATQYGKAAAEIEVGEKVVLEDRDDNAYTAGAFQFLSTAGGHTETNPLAATVHVQVVGYAVSANRVVLDVNVPHWFVPFQLVNTLPATAANFGSIWIAPENVRFIGGWESHAVAGNDAGAVTLEIEKLAATEALDSGTVISAATISLKSTANTPQVISPHGTVATARVAAGQRIALKDGGTPTNLAGVSGGLVFVRDI